MCVAIAKPADKRVVKRTLAAAFAQNPDGTGFAWYDEVSEMVWEHKGFWNFKDFWEAYRVHEHQNVLIHCRAATHGDKSNENCHPFRVGENVVMAHNGVLTDYLPQNGDTRSDTRIFAEELIAPILEKVIDPVEFVHSPQVLKLLKETVSWGNKLVFLTPKGFAFVRESVGWWVDGVWYSSGKPSWHQPYTSNTSAWGEDDWVGDGTSSQYYPNNHSLRGSYYGTKEYERKMRAEGFVRDGNAWVLRGDKLKQKHRGGGADPIDQDKEDDATVTEHLRRGAEPVNGSRPRDSQAAQASLQLALGTGESDTPSAEDDAPLRGVELWMAAQEDINHQIAQESAKAELDLIRHNRNVVLKGLDAVSSESVIHSQLMTALDDLDERERQATALANGGM